MREDEQPLIWNPDGKGLRGNYSDRPFDALAPETGREGLPVGEDAVPFTAPGPGQGSSPAPEGGLGIIPDVITALNGTAYLIDYQGKNNGPA